MFSVLTICKSQMLCKQYSIFKKINLFIYLLIYGCVGSLLMHAGFLYLQRVGQLFVAVRGLLIAVASLVVEHRL